MRKKLLIIFLITAASVALAMCITACDDGHVHTYSENLTAPTCTERGYTLYECSCGKKYRDDFTEPLGHTEVIDPETPATCQSEGLTEGKHCSVCNQVLQKQRKISLLPHTEDIVPALEPTCTQTGLTEAARFATQRKGWCIPLMRTGTVFRDLSGKR